MPVITCMVKGCPVKFNSRPDTVDTFFRHLLNRHQDLSDEGRWPHLNSLIRVGMSSGPNTYYWPPSPGNGPHLRPNQVNSLSVEEMQDPFLVAQWVACREFHNLMCKERPTAKKSGKTRKGGRTSSWEAPGAKLRKGREDGQSVTDDGDSGAASSSTSLTGASSYTSAPLRGRSHGGKVGSNTYTRQAARKEWEVAGKASQHETKSRLSPFPLHMKEKKGNK